VTDTDVHELYKDLDLSKIVGVDPAVPGSDTSVVTAPKSGWYWVETYGKIYLEKGESIKVPCPSHR